MQIFIIVETKLRCYFGLGLYFGIYFRYYTNDQNSFSIHTKRSLPFGNFLVILNDGDTKFHFTINEFYYPINEFYQHYLIFVIYIFYDLRYSINLINCIYMYVKCYMVH